VGLSSRIRHYFELFLGSTISHRGGRHPATMLFGMRECCLARGYAAWPRVVPRGRAGLQGFWGGNFGCGERDRDVTHVLSANIDTQIQKSPVNGYASREKPFKSVNNPPCLMDEYMTQNSPYN